MFSFPGQKMGRVYSRSWQWTQHRHALMHTNQPLHNPELTLTPATRKQAKGHRCSAQKKKKKKALRGLLPQPELGAE